ncbi:hypothetical protein CDD80_307 [Ophiocordyceps camponoti-rufipedis]|uniref:Uncharacterized protein n=1 Tax=Ophiocordyceps camponoti-rufipedis TaxID=2004952 RepID=A0A2C5ZEU3_9HYPO|nr:hypothetical protein CDD80_307 [Ophiocordyceps camponoti-rufipedis]
MTSLALFRLGFNKSADRNPMTVYISVDYTCHEESWDPVIATIQQQLDATDYGLRVHMEHGNIFHLGGFNLLEPAPENLQGFTHPVLELEYPYDDKIGMGANIGAGRYVERSDNTMCNPLTGTFGCYVEVLVRGKWEKYAITNYHVVRPALDGFMYGFEETGGKRTTAYGEPKPGSDLRKADEKGCKPNNRACDLESPARARHNWNVAKSRSLLRSSVQTHEGQNLRRQSSLAQKLAFFDEGKNKMGKLWAASGIVVKDTASGPKRLDWALIDVEQSRQGHNLLPTGNLKTFFDTEVLPHHLGGRCLRNPEPNTTLASIVEGEQLYKIGTITGATKGVFNEFKTCIRSDPSSYLPLPGEESQEYTIFGSFAKPGDSGSIVFKGSGEAVGLLWGGKGVHQTSEPFTFVTPLDDVFAHIKEVSGGVIEDVRISEQ